MIPVIYVDVRVWIQDRIVRNNSEETIYLVCLKIVGVNLAEVGLIFENYRAKGITYPPRKQNSVSMEMG